MGSIHDSLSGAFDVAVDDMARSLTGGGGVGSAPLTLMAVLAFGIVAQPIFIVCMTHIRPKTPLKGRAGSVWIVAAGLIFYGGAVATGRVGHMEHWITTHVAHPFEISVLGRDTCDPDRWAGCDLLFVEGDELWITRSDLRRSDSGRVLRPLRHPPRSKRTAAALAQDW